MTKVPQASFMPLHNGNDDLLKRLSAFLPKMAEANHELEVKLEETETGTNHVRLDSLLQKDNGDDDSDSSDKYIQDNNDNAKISSDIKPTIEMTVALGNLESNPIMSLLAPDDENEGDTLPDEQHIKAKENGDQKSFEIDLLGKSRKIEETQEQEDDEPLFTVRSTRRKRLPS